MTNENVNHPKHYGGENNPYEVIKVIEAWDLSFCLGNTVKYVARAGKKDPKKKIEDLEKANWYLQREIETLKGNPKTAKQIVKTVVKTNGIAKTIKTTNKQGPKSAGTKVVSKSTTKPAVKVIAKPGPKPAVKPVVAKKTAKTNGTAKSVKEKASTTQKKTAKDIVVVAPVPAQS